MKYVITLSKIKIDDKHELKTFERYVTLLVNTDCNTSVSLIWTRQGNNPTWSFSGELSTALKQNTIQLHYICPRGTILYWLHAVCAIRMSLWCYFLVCLVGIIYKFSATSLGLVGWAGDEGEDFYLLCRKIPIV